MGITIRGGPVKPFVPQHGMNQQTPANQHLVTTAVGNYITRGTKSKRASSKKGRAAGTAKRAKARHTSSRTKKARKTKGKAHMVKGSAAAKSHMAKLRKMRKK